MKSPIRIAFEQRIVTVKLEAILPLKKLSEALKQTIKYRRIAKSIMEVGVIEPLVVARSKEKRDQYLLLDGHVRLSALLEQGAVEARCLVSDDDEAFTYNKRVNRLATVQEHFMIVRAIERGVSQEKLAKALDLDVAAIKARRKLLDGICPEAIDLLKDRSINPAMFTVLRKMRPMRQIEAAELMTTAGNFTASYAKAILAATRQSDLVKSDQPKKIAGMTVESMARMEREMSALQQDFKQVEASYGDDILHLVIASGYLAKLVGNAEVERYLEQRHLEILVEFRAIIAATSLDQTQAMAA